MENFQWLMEDLWMVWKRRDLSGNILVVVGTEVEKIFGERELLSIWWMILGGKEEFCWLIGSFGENS